MTVADQSLAIFVLTVVLYGAAGISLFFRGPPFRVGLIMFMVSLLPLAWQAGVGGSDAPGFGVLLILMAPLPLLLMVFGALAALVRALRRLPSRRAGPTQIS